MFSFTEQQEAVQRHERECMNVGDRVAILNKWRPIAIRTVTGVTPKRIRVGASEYQKESGEGIGDSGGDILRGLATAKELEVAAQRIIAKQEKEREREKRAAKRQELELMLAHLNATVYESEFSGRWAIDNLTEDAVRLIGIALRRHAESDI